MDQQGQQDRNNRRCYVGSGRLTQRGLDNMATEQGWLDQPQPQPFCQYVTPPSRNNYPPRVCRTPTSSPERQPSSAETSPCSKEVESIFFPQSVNPRPTGVQGSAFQPVQPRNPPRGASGGRSPPAYSQRPQQQTQMFASAAEQPPQGRFIRGRTEQAAREQESAHKKARKCLMTPADFYAETQNFASTTAQPQREDSAQRRAEDIARECLMTPADFYLEDQD